MRNFTYWGDGKVISNHGGRVYTFDNPFVPKRRRFAIPLDLIAALLTGSSTLLLATGHRAGFLTLAAGACVWAAVALRARLGGRPIWWQVVSSVWTLCWSIYGWLQWHA